MPPEGGCMRAHSSLRLGTLRGRLLSFWSHRGIALGAFVWFGKRDSPTRRPLLPRNAGTAEPIRVSPPEAVAYPLELSEVLTDITGVTGQAILRAIVRGERDPLRLAQLRT